MEMIINVIIWAAVLQGLLLGLVFIFSKKYRSHANKLLGLFLISFVFTAISDLLPFNDIWGYPINGYFTLPEVKFLIPVLILNFVLEKVGKSSNYKLFLRIHYLLGFSILGLTAINIILYLITGKTLLEIFGWEILDTFYMGQQYYAFLLTISVLIISIKETLNYRNLIRNEFTDMALLDIKWLWQYILALTPIVLFWGAELLRIIMGGWGQSELSTIAYLFIALFIYFVSYKAFTKQTLFDGSTNSLQPSETYAEEPDRIDKPGKTVDFEICTNIIHEMEVTKSYLNQNLTLHIFARKIDVSARVISSCINQNLGLNFNEWVNNYRVDYAYKMIQSDKTSQLSIEGIGLDSGFKSRSAMYAAFKKKLGHSPGHFR
jgi:AraC-like DNA-binding protein